MGLIGRVFNLVFGDGRNIVRETSEVFWVNAEKNAERDAKTRDQALKQFGKEFSIPERGMFDRFMDAVNRLPRPALALGTLGLFVSAMINPVWFGTRMQGIALVPEPLWWLLGAIVSFYFGARHQIQGQAFQRSIAQTMAQVPTVVRNIKALQAGSAGAAVTGTDARLGIEVIKPEKNPAILDWEREIGANMR